MSVVPITSALPDPTDLGKTPATPWRITDALILCAAMIGLPTIFDHLVPEYVKQEASVTIGVQVGMDLALLVAAFLLIRSRGVNLRQLWLGRGNWFLEMMLALALAVPLVALAAGVNIGMRYLLGPPASVQRSAAIIDQLPFHARMVMCLAGISLVPLAEEVLFRGLLFESLRARVALWIALVAQAAVFVIAHRDSPQFTGGLLAAGLGYGAVYVWRRSLLSAFVMHAGFNTLPMAWLISLAFINQHNHATTWEEAERPPVWWSSPTLEKWVQKIPDHDSAQEQYRQAMVYGRHGLQLWKLEARAFHKVVERFPDDARYGSKSLGGIQEIYLYELRDARRAIVAGLMLQEMFPEQRHECAHAKVNNATAYLRLEDYDSAERLATDVFENYKDLPRAAGRARVLLDELEWRQPQ